MTDEDRILELMAAQTRLNAELEDLPSSRPSEISEADCNAKMIQLQQQHREVVCELIKLLDGPLRSAFMNARPKYENVGLQFTQMLNDFFVKLLEREVNTNQKMQTFRNLRELVATIFANQMRDYLKAEALHGKLNVTRRTGIDTGDDTHTDFAESGGDPNGGAMRRYLDEIAAETLQKKEYFEQRYQAAFVDFLMQLEEWEIGNDAELHLAARALLLHYVAGEKWSVIEHQLGISSERLTKIRKLAADKFRHR